MLLMILGALLCFQQSPTAVHLPTSTVIDVARKVARDLGYPIDRYPNLYFFDVLTMEDGKPWFAQYISVGFYGNGHPINHFEINERTGQIVDSSTCKLFDFKDLRLFQKAQQQLSGSKPKTMEELKSEIGCDTLTVVGKPIVRNTAPPSKK